MTRIKYETIKEGPGTGALKSRDTIFTTSDTLSVYVDPTHRTFAILNGQNQIIKTGSGKTLTIAKRVVRKELIKLGAILKVEKKSSVKTVLAKAKAVVATTETHGS